MSAGTRAGRPNHSGAAACGARPRSAGCPATAFASRARAPARDHCSTTGRSSPSPSRSARRQLGDASATRRRRVPGTGRAKPVAVRGWKPAVAHRSAPRRPGRPRPCRPARRARVARQCGTSPRAARPAPRPPRFGHTRAVAGRPISSTSGRPSPSQSTSSTRPRPSRPGGSAPLVERAHALQPRRRRRRVAQRQRRGRQVGAVVGEAGQRDRREQRGAVRLPLRIASAQRRTRRAPRPRGGSSTFAQRSSVRSRKPPRAQRSAVGPRLVVKLDAVRSVVDRSGSAARRRSPAERGRVAEVVLDAVHQPGPVPPAVPAMRLSSVVPRS